MVVAVAAEASTSAPAAVAAPLAAWAACLVECRAASEEVDLPVASRSKAVHTFWFDILLLSCPYHIFRIFFAWRWIDGRGEQAHIESPRSILELARRFILAFGIRSASTFVYAFAGRPGLLLASCECKEHLMRRSALTNAEVQVTKYDS